MLGASMEPIKARGMLWRLGVVVDSFSMLKDRAAASKIPQLNDLLRTFAESTNNLIWWDWAARFRNKDGTCR